MSRVLNSLPLLYLAMLWPGRFAFWGLFEQTFYYPWMMYDSGFWSIIWLIVTLAVTPCLMIISRLGRGKVLGRWLLVRRRHFGIASFIFALLHLVHYAIESEGLSVMIKEAVGIEFAVGWLAFVIFLALALTSNNWSTRKLGRKWKLLHYWVYPAALFAFLHWYLFGNVTERVIFWALALVAIKAVHMALSRRGRPQTRTQPSA